MRGWALEPGWRKFGIINQHHETEKRGFIILPAIGLEAAHPDPPLMQITN
jgi:hypothetical protein